MFGNRVEGRPAAVVFPDDVRTNPCGEVDLDSRRWFLQDEQRSVYGLLASNGTLMEGYEYDPYGQVTVFTPGSGEVDWLGSDVVIAVDDAASPYTYTARRHDAETGLMQYRTRYYWPDACRFVSRDKIGVWGDPNSLGNGYSNVGNMGHEGVDPKATDSTNDGECHREPARNSCDRNGKHMNPRCENRRNGERVCYDSPYYWRFGTFFNDNHNLESWLDSSTPYGPWQEHLDVYYDAAVLEPNPQCGWHTRCVGRNGEYETGSPYGDWLIQCYAALVMAVGTSGLTRFFKAAGNALDASWGVANDIRTRWGNFDGTIDAVTSRSLEEKLVNFIC